MRSICLVKGAFNKEFSLVFLSLIPLGYLFERLIYILQKGELNFHNGNLLIVLFADPDMPGQRPTAEVRANKDGSVCFSYVPKETGNHEMSATCNDKPVEGALLHMPIILYIYIYIYVYIYI